jgi:hypothetical protein
MNSSLHLSPALSWYFKVVALESAWKILGIVRWNGMLWWVATKLQWLAVFQVILRSLVSRRTIVYA